VRRDDGDRKRESEVEKLARLVRKLLTCYLIFLAVVVVLSGIVAGAYFLLRLVKHY
jgi:hypothetical protein